MFEGGEDPLYIARRLVVTASEDIGECVCQPSFVFRNFNVFLESCSQMSVFLSRFG